MRLEGGPSSCKRAVAKAEALTSDSRPLWDDLRRKSARWHQPCGHQSRSSAIAGFVVAGLILVISHPQRCRWPENVSRPKQLQFGPLERHARSVIPRTIKVTPTHLCTCLASSLRALDVRFDEVTALVKLQVAYSLTIYVHTELLRGFDDGIYWGTRAGIGTGE